MAQEQPHPIFYDIDRDDLPAVQQHVLADGAVLEERNREHAGMTPLMCAIACDDSAIAMWLVEHRGQHNLDAADEHGRTALH